MKGSCHECFACSSIIEFARSKNSIREGEGDQDVDTWTPDICSFGLETARNINSLDFSENLWNMVVA